MNTIEILKCLAEGIIPETGEPLPKNSIAHQPETIRALYKLADELFSKNLNIKQKPSDADKIQKNIEMDRPPRSHLPWTSQDKIKLGDLFNAGHSIESLASDFQRSPLAVAIQLENMKLISKAQSDSYRPIANKTPQ